MSDISKIYISSLIPKNSTILDIGSYNGKDAAELAAACDSDVHCFEPVSYGLIKDLCNDRLIIWPYAVTSYNGTTMMNVCNHPQSNSIKTPKVHKKLFPDIIYENEMKKINCTNLDSWNWSVRKGAPVDFIWIDVNGSEADFLMGASKTLTVTSYLYIEFCQKELFAKALNRENMIKALPGFEVMGEYNFKGNFGNLLFKNKSI